MTMRLIAWVDMNGTNKCSYHNSIEESKKWIGYMIFFYGAKPLQIEDEQGNIILTGNKTFVKW